MLGLRDVTVMATGLVKVNPPSSEAAMYAAVLDIVENETTALDSVVVPAGRVKEPIDVLLLVNAVVELS
jgi:hypothetical protein